VSPSKPSFKHLLTDPLPNKLFLDTNFLISFLFSKNPKKDNACKEFLIRIRDEIEKNKNFVVCFNTVVYYEVYLAFAKQQLEIAGRSKKLLMSDPEAIKPYIPKISRHYEKLIEIIDGLRRVEFKLNDKKLVDTILKTQVEYKLHTADAFHLGTMLFAGEKDLASFDTTDFGKIPNINLWCVY